GPEDPLVPRLMRLRFAVMSLSSEAFRPLNLGIMQAALLRFLRVHPGSSPSDYASFMGADSAAVVRLVDSLEKRGLVRREDDPSDRRRWTLALTPSGEKLSRDVARLQRGIRERLRSALTEREMRALLGLLDKAIAGISA